MDEVKAEVIAESSPAEEVVEQSQQEATPSEEVVESSETPEVKPEVIKDNRPIENVAWETKRKLDETLPTIQRQIEELTSFVKENRTQPQTPEYSRAMLNAYALDPSTTTEQRLWALTEVEKKEKAERIKDYETLMNSTRQKSESENRRANSANWVAQTFPETVVKDPIGNVQWNQSSPLLARANGYMNQSESLRNDPDGFMAAVKMAAFDLGVSMNLQNKVNKTVGQLRKEQKKQLASSGGTSPAVNKDGADKIKYAKLVQKYAETNDRATFEEIVKMRKLNPFS